jgi:type IV pilus assembly protein PilB
MNTSGQQKPASGSSTTKNRKALLIRGGRTPFETKLIESGHATSEQYDRALEKSEEEDVSLLVALQDVLNQALPPDIARYYKRIRLLELKLLYGFECLDPDIDVEKFSVANISGLIESDVIPMSTCRTHEVLPLVKKDSTLLVGMVHPDNFKAIDDLSMLASKQELALQRRVITREDFNDLLERIIEAQVNKSASGESFSDDALRIDDDAFADDTLGEVHEEGDDLTKAIGENSAPVINLVDKILVKALQEGASDIHIEPQEKNLRIRFRRDGVLREVFFLNDDRRLPKSIISAVIARFKIISNLNIAERRVPQDGKLKRVFQKRRVDFRVNTCPSQHGEKVVLRILDNSNTQLGLDKLITDPESLEIMQDMAKRPYGLILVTGPTGSGKTTTLYSALAEVNDPGINISTAEDPVEYNLPGLTQCQVIRAKGMDFAT